MQAAAEIRLAMAELKSCIADCEVIADAGSQSSRPNWVVWHREAKVPVPTDVLEARAQGRAEALAIILGIDAETGLDGCTYEYSIGATGEYATGWKEDALRELLRSDDSAWSLMQEAESEYWHNLGLREEAERNYARSQSAVVLDDDRAALEIAYQKYCGQSHRAQLDNHEAMAFDFEAGWTARAASAQSTAPQPALTDKRAHEMYEAAMSEMMRGGPYESIEASTAAVVRALLAARVRND
jgi:hypothetical protein